MTGSLTIRTLTVDHFGPWAGAEFILPDAPLVVIHGPNESGKSSLATLVAWLLGGPHGKAEAARRFGAAGTTVGGRLSGSVRGLPFEAQANFEILQKRTPNARGLTVRLGDRNLSAEEWGRHLGGLDATVLAAIYRLWGEDLHAGGDVTEALSKVALAGLSGQVDVRQLANTLADDVKAAATASGASDTSVQTLAREIDQLGQHLMEAGQSADRHAVTRQRLAELTEQRDLVARQHAEAERRYRVIDTVLSAAGAYTRLDELTSELHAVETVPPEWERLAADPTAVRQAVDHLRQARDNAREAHDHLARAAGVLGIDSAQAASLAVTDGDVTELTRLVARLAEHDKRADQAALAVATAAEAMAAARTATDDALVPTRGATRETLSAALVQPSTQVDLGQAVAAWQLAVTRAETEGDVVAAAQAAVEAAALDAERAGHAWQQWGTNLTPQAWIAGGSPNQVTSIGSPGVRRRAVVGVTVAGLVVAAVGAVFGQWLVSAATGGAALGVIATIVLFRRQAAPVSVHPSSAHGEQAQAAQHVVAAQSTLDEARKHLQQATARRDQAHHEVRLAHQKVLALCDGFAMPVAVTVEATRALHESWFRVAQVLHAERHAERQFEVCRRAHEHAAIEVSGLELQIHDVALRIGLPAGSAPRVADTLAAAALETTTAWRAFDTAQSHLTDAEGAWTTLLAPVASQVQGWRPERVADRACELAQLTEERHKLSQLVAQAQRDLTTQLGSDSEVHTLHDAQLPRSDLDALLAAAEAERARADQERQQLSEQIGELGVALDELATTERIARLRVGQGTLREQQAELAVDALVAKVAGRVLRDAADQYERQHQPAIVERATRLALAVAANWRNILVRPDGTALEVLIDQGGGARLRADQLSTGGRALLYLAFRAAMAEHDAEQRGVRLPLLCDDPLVHLDDDRAREVMPVLAGIAERGHQVVLFTCHRRTVDAARDLGGAVLELPGLSAGRR